MIAWVDGLERGPHGTKYRQIPEPFVWSSALFISKTGAAWRRHFNTVTREWHWADEPTLPVEEPESGRMGLSVGTHWAPLETCIALAWRHRHPESSAPALREGRQRELSARSIRWPQEEEEEEGGPIEGETWKPLAVRIGVVPTTGLGYQISTIGRLKNPSGEVTRGFWAPMGSMRGRRWAAVRGAGLCDLDSAAGLQSGIQQPLSIQLALAALMTGRDAEELAAEARIKVSSAWAYLNKAAMIAPPDELRRVWKDLVHRVVVRELKRMQGEGDARLGDSLTTLRGTVEERLQPSSSYFVDLAEADRWRHLRFVRIALTRVGMAG